MKIPSTANHRNLCNRKVNSQKIPGTSAFDNSLGHQYPSFWRKRAFILPRAALAPTKWQTSFFAKCKDVTVKESIPLPDPMAGRNLDLYPALARQLRADSIRCSTAAGSGHPTSSIDVATRIGQTRRATRGGGNLSKHVTDAVKELAGCGRSR